MGLGVRIDVASAHSNLTVYAAPFPDRMQRVLASLVSCRSQDFLSPATASSIKGKLGFIFGTSYYRFGRAALQPLMQREYFDSKYSFSAPLPSRLEFMQYVLPVLPPLAMPLRPSSIPPLIVYTDAMFTPGRPIPVVRIGWVVFDPISGDCFHSHFLPDSAYISMLTPNQRTYIMQAEGIGAVSPALSLPSLFRGRHVVQFMDNTAALSSLINGYASKPDMARIVNVYHLSQFFMRSQVWLEWIPSPANIADLPSRLMYEVFVHYLPQSRWIPSVLPPAAVWGGSFRALAAHVQRML